MDRYKHIFWHHNNHTSLKFSPCIRRPIDSTTSANRQCTAKRVHKLNSWTPRSEYRFCRLDVFSVMMLCFIPMALLMGNIGHLEPRQSTYGLWESASKTSPVSCDLWFVGIHIRLWEISNLYLVVATTLLNILPKEYAGANKALTTRCVVPYIIFKYTCFNNVLVCFWKYVLFHLYLLKNYLLTL